MNEIILFFPVIHEDPAFMVTSFQQAAYYYLSPSRVMRPPDEEQPIDIKSLLPPFQNLPVWSPNSLPILKTSTSPFPENTLKHPTEPPTEPFIDPIGLSPESTTEPSTDPSTDLSIDSSNESSTYYW